MSDVTRRVEQGDRHPIRILVKAFDRRQRQRLGIREFTADEKCIMRVGEAHAMRDIVLSDGTTVCAGDRIGVLHLWNERLPVMPENGPDLAWARETTRSLKYSFGLLAEHVMTDPSMTGIEAFGGDLTFVYSPAGLRILDRLGIETSPDLSMNGVARCVVDAAMRIWTWLLRWAFNPASVHGKGLGVFERRAIWLSVRRLIELYGTAKCGELCMDLPQ